MNSLSVAYTDAREGGLVAFSFNGLHARIDHEDSHLAAATFPMQVRPIRKRLGHFGEIDNFRIPAEEQAECELAGKMLQANASSTLKPTAKLLHWKYFGGTIPRLRA